MGLELARARRLPDSCFAGENRLYLAHDRQRSLEGSWRGVTGLRRASCGFGVDAARAGLCQTPADSCVGWKGPPAPGPCQAWRGQAEAGRRHPKKVNFSKNRPLGRCLLDEAS